MGNVVWNALAFAGVASAAMGQIVVVGADGSDGVFNPTSSTQVPLQNAVNGLWDAASTSAGAGVYDSQQWAVVFKYSSVDIPAGVTVTFHNHPSRAPVVWLVSGNVTINGTLKLDGQGEQGENVLPIAAEPGPGGFRGAFRCDRSGGTARSGSAGFGPRGGLVDGGGCSVWSTGGGFRSAGICNNPLLVSGTYGHASMVPLVGGSGGGRVYTPGSGYVVGGSGGGGAILIAATGTISINGQVYARGGLPYAAPAGAGGGVRLVAESIIGPTAVIDTRPISNIGIGVSGGSGAVRMESNLNTISDLNVFGERSTVLAPTSEFRAFPLPSSNPPSMKVLSIDGRMAPDDPRAEFGRLNSDVSVEHSGSVPVVIETRNINPSQYKVEVRFVPLSGDDGLLVATLQPGSTTALATWEVLVPIEPDFSTVVQATASQVVGALTQDARLISREVSTYVGSCPADLDDGMLSGAHDGAVTIDDLLFFLVKFEEGDPSVDLDNDGLDPGVPDGGVTIDDLLYFLSHFERGC